MQLSPSTSTVRSLRTPTPISATTSAPFPWLRELIGNGCRVILYTMRSGRLLDDAVAWFARNDIPLYAVNENPAQREWTDSPKVFADLYIDDSALGCPIKFEDGIKRPFVNWVKVRQRLVEEGFLD